MLISCKVGDALAVTDLDLALQSLGEWLFGQADEAAFSFSMFDDPDTAAPAIHGRSLAAGSRAASAPPVSQWAGSAADGARVSFSLDHETGAIELRHTRADGTTRSVRSQLQLVESLPPPDRSWLFHIPHPERGEPLGQLSVHQNARPASQANADRIRWIVPSWVADVESKADRFDAELLRVSRHRPSMQFEPDYQTARRAIDTARWFATRPTLTRGHGAAARRPRTWRRIADWWTGYCVDMAWGELHTASQALLAIQDEGVVRSQLADLAAAVVTELTDGDLRIGSYLGTLKALAPPSRHITPDDRAQLRAIRAVCDSSADGGHADARSFRNTLILIGSFLTVVLTAVVVAAAANTSFAALFSVAAHPGPWYVFEVELVASLSGLTGAVLALHSYTGFRWTYGLPVVQALLKGATGAATGLFGVILVRSGVVTALKVHSNVEVFAVAIVFGYAQYLFTRLIDQKAKDVLKSASSRNDPDVAARIPADVVTPSVITTSASP
jgi:hypothetical protein